ncbi:hypothetical protein ACFBZI_09220 [Moraxella sp. ZJ142]|uniref:hypothetical protein n=1 Tax=Moraxella marmotae TaxID=3344520 RepID=UPI0035D45C8A
MINRLFASGCLVAAVVMVATLTACQKTPTDETAKTAENLTAQSDHKVDYVGCYTIDKDTPAAIKISRQNGHYVMQMKEPKGKASVWDNPEPLTLLPKANGWQSFAVNAINLSVSDVTGEIVARPDGIMAIAQVHETTANTNPLVDSPYVVALMGAVNTIYQVPCDEIRQ